MMDSSQRFTRQTLPDGIVSATRNGNKRNLWSKLTGGQSSKDTRHSLHHHTDEQHKQIMHDDNEDRLLSKIESAGYIRSRPSLIDESARQESVLAPTISPTLVPDRKMPAFPRQLVTVEEQPLIQEEPTNQDPTHLVCHLSKSENNQRMHTLSEQMLGCALSTGLYSDVTVRFIQKDYQLHRIVLSRSPSFQHVLSQHLNGQMIELSIPVDCVGFEIVLQWIYGDKCLDLLPQQLVSAFVASEFFGMQELHDSILHSIIDSISPTRSSIDCHLVLDVIGLVDSNDHSESVALLEESILKLLYIGHREMLDDVFIRMPAVWLQQVLESDVFYCQDEFSRYLLAKNVISRRRDKSLADNTSNDHVLFMESVYAEIFRCAIIYTHMSFEQLNVVQEDSIVPENILMTALWLQTRFKACVENSESDGKLFFAQSTSDDNSTPAPNKSSSFPPIRVGLTFINYKSLVDGERSYSNPFFFGGSYWRAFLQRFPQTETNDDISTIDKWGVFLRRCEQDFSVKPMKTQYTDKRSVSVASFKLYNSMVKVYDPIFESRMNEYAPTQSWGYRSASNIISTEYLNASQAAFEYSSTRVHSELELKLSIVLTLH